MVITAEERTQKPGWKRRSTCRRAAGRARNPVCRPDSKPQAAHSDTGQLTPRDMHINATLAPLPDRFQSENDVLADSLPEAELPWTFSKTLAIRSARRVAPTYQCAPAGACAAVSATADPTQSQQQQHSSSLPRPRQHRRGTPARERVRRAEATSPHPRALKRLLSNRLPSSWRPATSRPSPEAPAHLFRMAKRDTAISNQPQ